MNIILLGAPGAGKGTQAANIIEKYSAKRVATGDMLRSEIQNQTPIGLKVKEIMAAGQLVSEEIILEIVKNAIANEMNKSLLFDGFPRTVNQAQFLSKLGIPIDYVIEIHVPDEDIINRLGGRWVHPASGRVYHEVNNPPLKKWYDEHMDFLTKSNRMSREEAFEKLITMEPFNLYLNELEVFRGSENNE